MSTGAYRSTNHGRYLLKPDYIRTTKSPVPDYETEYFTFQDPLRNGPSWDSLSGYQRSFKSTDWLRVKKRVPVIRQLIRELKKSLNTCFLELCKVERVLAKHRLPYLDCAILAAVESSAILLRICNELRCTSMEKETYKAYREFASLVNEALEDSDVMLLKLRRLTSHIREIETIVQEDLLPAKFNELTDRILEHIMKHVETIGSTRSNRIDRTR